MTSYDHGYQDGFNGYPFDNTRAKDKQAYARGFNEGRMARLRIVEE